jgi:hypothetical protein
MQEKRTPGFALRAFVTPRGCSMHEEAFDCAARVYLTA